MQREFYLMRFCGRFWKLCLCMFALQGVCLSDEFGTNMQGFNIEDESLVQSLKSQRQYDKASKKVQDSQQKAQKNLQQNTNDFANDEIESNTQESTKSQKYNKLKKAKKAKNLKKLKTHKILKNPQNLTQIKSI